MAKRTEESTFSNTQACPWPGICPSVPPCFSTTDTWLWEAQWSSGQRARPAATRSWVRVRWLQAVVGQLLFAPWAWAYSTLHPLGSVNEYRLQLSWKGIKAGTCDVAWCAPCTWGVSLKHYGPTGQTMGQTEWRATGHPPTQACGGCLARRSRRQAAWIYIARFVTWSNQCELLHLLH